jgi:hypothetical protein
VPGIEPASTGIEPPGTDTDVFRIGTERSSKVPIFPVSIPSARYRY